MNTKILVRYGEIALKGKNRGQFEQQLLRNMKSAVSGSSTGITRLHGRFLVEGPAEKETFLIRQLQRVFGIVSLSPVTETALELEEIKTAAVRITKALPPGLKTFKVEARRSNKKFPLTSPELNSQLGAHLLHTFPGLEVRLQHPSFTLSVEIGYHSAFLYSENIAGPGGLPVRISGRALLLLSGGIDSPVAGWLSMKRGLAIEALHFHSFPFTSRKAEEKAVDLCRHLSLWGNRIPLHLMSITPVQKLLQSAVPSELRIIILRRIMIRLAEKLCNERKMKAIITGDNLGQVASQTLESLAVTEQASQMLILRPLIGMDKREIIRRAEAIDSYDISIRPHEDCCTLLVPKNPATKPKLEAVAEAEGCLDLSELLDEAYNTLETRTGNFIS
ncbi:MAG: tRNA uracil 4-sulfurtransferase ThiI [Bacillota bacterium]|nr:tRNA uracil 4-sulfurtransferase ThiI [Bacillota bacterium]